MDAAQIKRIRAVFDVIAKRGDQFVARFYERLFNREPALRSLFPDNMQMQYQHLLDILVYTVKHLDNPQELEPALIQLGARHVGYGARPEHYVLVEETLIATIREFSGSKFNAEAEADWREALTAVSVIMIRGAREAQEK